MMFAAIAMDGTRPKVYGLGESEMEAESDALIRMAEDDVELIGDEVPALAVLELTDEQARSLAAELKDRDAVRRVAGPEGCPARSGLRCEYNKQTDPSHEECVYCGQPETRQ